MKTPKFLLTAPLLVLTLAPAQAQTILWDGTASGTNLSLASNWDGNVAPTGASQIGLIDNTLVTPPAVINLNTTSFNGATIRLNHAGTTLNSASGSGATNGTKFDLLSGGITTATTYTLGNASTSGQYSQSGGTLTVGTTLSMNAFGGNSFTVTGGNVTATAFTPNASTNSYSITGSTSMNIDGIFSTNADNGVIGGAASITANSMNLAAAGRIQVLAGSGTFVVDTSFVSTNWQGEFDFTGAGYKLNIFGFNLAAYQTEWAEGDLLWNGSNAGTFSDHFSVSGSTLTAIPEPTTWMLLTGGLTAMMIFRRRSAA